MGSRGMPADEFETIARLFRPLTGGAPEALDLLDDAAVLPCRPGFDLVITKDAIVEGVHFLPGDPLDLVARKLLRVNLSDLAAKAAEPYAYFLAVGWPEGADRDAFARGLAEDGQAYGLNLLGGDTTAAPGSLFASVTMLGWVPEGRMVKRSGARPGHLLAVSGPIGDGFLGLKAARGELDDPALADRYRLPHPRTDLREPLRIHARAAADISDGLLADAGHLAEASGCRVHVDLDRMPLSPAGRRFGDRLALATGGDDYEIVCALEAPLEGFTIVGEFTQGEGVAVTRGGREITPERLGYRHR
ncbi:MAG TPA: thiamine-phosphate kinase [Caulobacteraceae bacterium]